MGKHSIRKRNLHDYDSKNTITSIKTNMNTSKK